MLSKHSRNRQLRFCCRKPYPTFLRPVFRRDERFGRGVPGDDRGAGSGGNRDDRESRPNRDGDRRRERKSRWGGEDEAEQPPPAAAGAGGPPPGDGLLGAAPPGFVPLLPGAAPNSDAATGDGAEAESESDLTQGAASKSQPPADDDQRDPEGAEEAAKEKPAEAGGMFLYDDETPMEPQNPEEQEQVGYEAAVEEDPPAQHDEAEAPLDVDAGSTEETRTGEESRIEEEEEKRQAEAAFEEHRDEIQFEDAADEEPNASGDQYGNDHQSYEANQEEEPMTETAACEAEESAEPEGEQNEAPACEDAPDGTEAAEDIPAAEAEDN